VNPPQARRKPRLRGVSHEVAAFAAAPAASILVAEAQGALARTAALTYGATLLALFFVSALFHRPTWSPRARRTLSRLDNSAIFAFIGGTYTPLCLLAGRQGRALLVTVWICVGVGVLVSIRWPDAPKRLMVAFYSVVGWLFVTIVPALDLAIGQRSVVQFVGGACVYSAGALVYAFQKPDPVPAVFGYHEIFHLLVVLGAASQFMVIRAAIGALG